MFEAVLLGGIFLAAMFVSHWLLDKWGIPVTLRYMDFGGILSILLMLLLVVVFFLIVGAIKSVF